MFWNQKYEDLVRSLPQKVANSQLTLCGLATVLDAVISLDKAVPHFRNIPDEGNVLVNELVRRAHAGVGGEIRIDWADGAEWLNKHVPFELAVGGTGAHAARALTILGAPALLAVRARSAEMLAGLGPKILLSCGGRAVSAADVAAGEPDHRRLYIFEITAGVQIAGKSAPRSTRVIVRLHDEVLDIDEDFVRASLNNVLKAGAGVMSGFSILSQNDISREVGAATRLGARWLKHGLPLLHLELAGYATDLLRDYVLNEFADVVNSIGMSYSEFQSLVGKDVPLKQGLADIAARYKVKRVCVHADDWAAALTCADMERERQALMMGCLLASTRAAAGKTIVPTGLPPSSKLGDVPFEDSTDGQWKYVACPAPWLEKPTTTLGLGDTFMAGCLFVLGARAMYHHY
ncbi:ADP-dependent phosphofructokinase/glucokinase [Herbaspirillum sp. 1173]|uniref:ADP-dependent glucokinase/phosphofructokinase n=1 Tax=Herbaspirillum sp. 1173 TaxID=2817734 RepID=UPI00285494D6|nr:ADP-dependent glucokinase/phosphofructokinase [Herbaspirillum sp. 1173]MDR6743315.1 ADP-dependent phosphofructokinase/glucokinase [Herbaspirillum sp. 1173]